MQPLLPVLNTWTIRHLRAGTQFPRESDPADQVAFIQASGFVGLQMAEDDVLIPAGHDACMHLTGTGRVLVGAQADQLCRVHKDLGFQATTLHVGTGLETIDQGLALVEAVLTAAARHSYALHVETHRATLTQDLRRTLDLVAAFPELTLNADLSHWYCGLEMPYGDFAAKLDLLEPVFDRVRYIHARIADSCCMQVPVGTLSATPVRHFDQMWQRCIGGFIRHAHADAPLPFAPELLPHRIEENGETIEVNYARLADGVEETDRWAEALKLLALGRAVADAARANLPGKGIKDA